MAVSKAIDLPVLDMQGDTVATLAVSDYLFGVPMNTAVVHQAMLMQRANARQGTHSVKTRADVSGGGAKPWRQKGTGRARQGSIRSPHFRGGGVVFGPHPRSYRQRMPKKMRRLAIRCLLSDKVREERLAILQELQFPQAKTREMKQFLDTLNVSSSILIVTPEATKPVVDSARNLPQVKTLPAANLNVLDLLNYDRLIMTVAAIRKAEALWDPETTLAEVEASPLPTPKRKRPASSAATAEATEKTAPPKRKRAVKPAATATEAAPAEAETAPPKRKRTVKPAATATEAAPAEAKAAPAKRKRTMKPAATATEAAPAEAKAAPPKRRRTTASTSTAKKGASKKATPKKEPTQEPPGEASE